MSLSYRRDIKRQMRRRKNLAAFFTTLSLMAIVSVITYLVLIKPSVEQYKLEQDELADRIEIEGVTPDSIAAKNTELLYSQSDTDTEAEASSEDTDRKTETITEDTSDGTTESASEDTGVVPVTTLNAGYNKSTEPVDDSYFDDAVFIGDSRTEGFSLYSDLAEVNTYSSKGLSITRIYEDAIVPQEDGDPITVMEALENVHYSKIYIMFGVNELGWVETDIFREKYETMIADIRARQPDSIIYVQGIIPVSAERSATDPIYNNDRVRQFNEEIKQACMNQNVVYLDVGSALVDASGALPAAASTDGIHCNSEYCNIWLAYLKQNTYTAK